MDFGERLMKISKILGVALISTVIGACGGGGGGSSSGGDSGGDSGSMDPQSIEGLSMPEAVSVVSSSTEVAGLRISAMKRLLKMIPQQVEVSSFNSSTTEYSTDEVHTYVWDESMESLEIINEIMCYIGQTGYKEMVNQDPYLALINGDECRKSGNESSQNDQSSGSNATSYETWTVSSTRASSTADQIVNIWFSEVDERTGEPDGYMRVQTIVSEGVSDEKPFGEFTLNFEMYDDEDANTGGGVLKTTTPPAGSPDGAVAFMFYESGTESENMGGGPEVEIDHTTQIKVVFDDADGNTGVAVAKRIMAFEGDDLLEGDALDWFESENKAYDIAFDGTHFYTAVFEDRAADTLVVDSQSCMNRSEFDTQVWNYNLYYKVGDNAGARVSIDSGFPFKAEVDGEPVFGHIGYWGIWVDYGVNVSDITTLVRENFGPGGTGDEAPEEYTLVQAPGKMIKSTKTAVDLADIEGMSLGWWPWIPPECTDENSDLEEPCEGVEQISEGTEYVVEYTSDSELSGNDTAASDAPGFYVVGTRSWGDSGQVINNDDPAFKISLPWLNFWSQQLGGSVSYPFVDDEGAKDETKATIFVESFVNGADSAFGSASAITLNCFQECLKGEISQAEIDQAEGATPFYDSIEQVWDEFGPVAPTEAAAVYSFDKATLTLTVTGGASVPEEDYGKVVRLGTAASPITPGSNSQYNWGIQSQAMLTSIVGLETVWDTWNADVSYRWETGANSWNIYSAVKDADGDYVQFQAPIQMLYKHDDANDINWETGAQTEQHNATYMLEYGGEGQLWGLPWDNGCDEGEGGEGGEGGECSGRWGNTFSLKDATTLTDGTTYYVVKGIQREQSMIEDDIAECDTLASAVDVDLELPTSADVDGITQDMASYANKPVVTDAPAVIEGEVQIVLE